MISHLNDILTERMLFLVAREHGMDLSRLCWLALGSEGRSEQTISTDQDNALILRDDVGETERRDVLALVARDVNHALDACGYPLCKGGVMAGNPDCCLSLAQWRARFSGWIQQGAPQDLLNASIYFDFRALTGDVTMAQLLRSEVSAAARSVPRFLKQMALNALTHQVALGWLGNIALDGRGRIDLKLQGTPVVVDAVRVHALAQGIEATSTRERLIAAGPRLCVPATEYEAWVAGFEFHKTPRLRVQLDGSTDSEQANQIEVAALNDIDRRILKASLRMTRVLQQREDVAQDQAMRVFSTFVGRSPLLAFHAAFDQALISRFARAHLGGSLHNPWIDIEHLCAVTHECRNWRDLTRVAARQRWIARP
jgi:CBS domain-containing protein